jgi:hypothetical protein
MRMPRGWVKFKPESAFGSRSGWFETCLEFSAMRSAVASRGQVSNSTKSLLTVSTVGFEKSDLHDGRSGHRRAPRKWGGAVERLTACPPRKWGDGY